MKNMSIGIATAMASLMAVVAAPPAVADDFRCVGAVRGGVFDNVVVPEGAACDIADAQIRGNVKVLSGSILLLSGGNRIGGNVDADKARGVDIVTLGNAPNVISGNGVIVEGALGTSICGAVLPFGNIIVVKNQGNRLHIGGSFCQSFGGGNEVERGNIKVEDSVIGDMLDVSDNRVGQNLQVFKNTGSALKLVRNNVAGESVQCFENTPPFIGGSNSAPKREGQCF